MFNYDFFFNHGIEINYLMLESIINIVETLFN